MVKLVGIDLGTSGVRFERYDLEGNILSTGRSEIREQSCAEWLRALQKAVPKKVEYSPSEEVILSVQSTSGTVIMVDEYGNDVFRPLMYFERAPEEAMRLESMESAQELKRRGGEVGPTSPLPKILRVKKEHPTDYLKARWILSPSTWLLYRLCIREGEIWDDVCTDWTNALKFGVDLTQSPPAWHTPIFQETGVSVNLLPKIVPCGSEIGRAESRLAEKIGLRGARIFQGMTDGNASALAVGCLKESDFGFSCGTTTAVKYVCNSMKVHNAIYYHKHPFEGYLAGAAPITAGILDWFAKKVIGIPIEDAFRMAERMPPETECQFYPQGDRSPFNDPKLGASFLGIWPDEASLDETRGRLFRSIVVGLTFFEYYYIQLFETLFDSKIEEVRITGGGTRTPWWNDLRASVYGLPVKVLEERPGIGALIPAVVRLRLLSLEEVTKKLLRVLAVHAPDERLKEKYEDRRKAFLKKWEKLREAYSLQ